MNVSEIMNTSVVTVTVSDTAAEAARLLARHNIGAVPVTSDDGHLRGILTDRDIITRCIAAELDPADTRCGEIMTKSVLTVTTDDDVREAARKMSVNRVRRVPVTLGEHLVGIVALADMARHPKFDMEASHALTEISSNVRRV
ncbi:MAG: CBS domain-containing protein [Oscillospiraceae bacterium]|jgi:CBS domain-containing protein|nr:CBS domain-containing protein [Oscillospiraceae bacterium]